MLLSNGENIGNIITEPKIPQGLLNVFTRDCLLGFLLADIVCLGGDQSDEFNTAFHKQVARILGEGLTGAGGQNFGDNFLDRGCRRYLG